MLVNLQLVISQLLLKVASCLLVGLDVSFQGKTNLDLEADVKLESTVWENYLAPNLRNCMEFLRGILNQIETFLMEFRQVID